MYLLLFLLAARWLGIALPIFYAGITFQYTLTTHLLSHIRTGPAPPKVLAKQWLALYQLGPYFVPPLILPGTLSNAYLAYVSSYYSKSQFFLHSLAAVLTISIMPMTFLYFEPGINGACKWKVAMLLESEETKPKLSSGGKTEGKVGWSTQRHSTNAEAKVWAERAEMVELVAAWASRNHIRWVVAATAGVVSGLATLGAW